METIRTFIAVLLSDEIKKSIAEIQSKLKKAEPDLKWTEPELFHITLKFLGNIESDRITEIKSALEEIVKSFNSFEMSFESAGAFPNAERTRVVWVGIKNGKNELTSLAAQIEKELKKLGFEPEEREFKGHITIGRAKTVRYSKALADALKNIDANNIGGQIVESISIMQSELTRKGPIYSELEFVKFNKVEYE